MVEGDPNNRLPDIDLFPIRDSARCGYPIQARMAVLAGYLTDRGEIDISAA